MVGNLILDDYSSTGVGFTGLRFLKELLGFLLGYYRIGRNKGHCPLSGWSFLKTRFHRVLPRRMAGGKLSNFFPVHGSAVHQDPWMAPWETGGRAEKLLLGLSPQKNGGPGNSLGKET